MNATLEGLDIMNLLVNVEGLNIMMNATVEAMMFSGYKVVKEEAVSITHLQFTDTLVLGENSWANIRVLQENLIIFVVISSSKVSFNRIMLIAVNVSESWSVEALEVLNCKIIKPHSFLYLGIPIGGDPSRLVCLWVE
ncbi:hypothetical protein MTR_2g033950 [Medicago truncatula]|uniref:Uncharacterized protein n=1 Tax=Medicago truncatula TaxID=3880 RepID=G7IMT5_MEDTR|nr:hypothetical protein MTR_2g033950 [Medicago truncatula]